MSWSTANHEVIPEQGFSLPDSSMHPYLWAFLQSNGETFRESVDDYSALRRNIAVAIQMFSGRQVQGRAPGVEVGGSRLRTWKALFERAGLLTVTHEGTIQVSPFGRAVRDLFSDLAGRVSGANDHLAKWAITVLGRYPLLNPVEGTQGADGESYPPDSDLLPFRAIWLAARSLGDQLHWQELNRGLMLANYQSEVPQIIERIRAAREAGGEHYFSDPAPWLGPDVAVDDGLQTTRRVTPWLSRAGFGGLLAEVEETSGLWKLRPERIPLIDEALRDTVVVPADARNDKAAFLRWLSSPIDQRNVIGMDQTDVTQLHTVASSARTYGKSKIICLTGIPGTGKSRLGRMVAEELTDGDPYRMLEIQFHEGTGYEDFVEGFVPKADGSGFKLADKVLRTITRRAATDPQSRLYVLLIEEFTRANTHAVLGELLTYVEHRGRKFHFSISQDEAWIPDNLLIIATMNPRDRSAAQLDAAVRRRLHYVSVVGSAEAMRSMLQARLPLASLDALAEWYRRWQPILPFGHGAFADVNGEPSIREVWEGTCLHLLDNALGEPDVIYRDAIDDFPWRS